MSALPGALRAKHQQERIEDDWYTEPDWVDDQLFAAIRFPDPIYDPCCGEGRIVEAARRAGYRASGGDLADRGCGETGIDFLRDNTPRTTLVFNPPGGDLVDKFIMHALEVATDAVAAIVRVGVLCGQERFWGLYKPSPPSLILPCSQRPSMPPGGRGIKAHNGTENYVWLIWSRVPLKRRRKCGIVPNGWYRPPHGTAVDWLEPLVPLQRRSKKC